MTAMPTAVFPYQSFGPYHTARLAHARRAFEDSGMRLVPVQLFGASNVYRWGETLKLDIAVHLQFKSQGNDSIRYRDVPTLFSTLTRLKPAVIFVNGWGTRDAIAMHAWCVAHKVPRVLVSDSTFDDKRRCWSVEFGKRLIVGGCQAAFVAGRPQMHYMKRLGIPNDKIFLGCDVIDNKHFASAQFGRNRRGRRLLTVARFEPGKNLLAAARAFLRFVAVRPRDEDWHWTIVGYGSQRDDLQRLAATGYGRLSVADFKTYEELPYVYAQANLYFQPSSYEPWGLAVNEAMASGLPVLVSNKCGCADDLVAPDVGWVFEPHSEEAITAGLQAAALGYERWQSMGKAAAKRIADWDLDRFSNGAVQAARLALDGPPA